MKIDIIAQELEKPEYSSLAAAQDYPGLSQQLNQKPLINNPTPQADIPKPITILELFNCVTPQEGLEIYKIPNLKPDIDHAIANSLRQNLAALLAIVSQLISEESSGKIQALLSEEIPDPSYQPQISGQSRAEELGIYPVTNEDIQSALNPTI
jgi:hypothetical protein